MKKNKIQGSNVIVSNGSKQSLHLIEYTQQSDINDRSFLPWDVLNAEMVNQLVDSNSAA